MSDDSHISTVIGGMWNGCNFKIKAHGKGDDINDSRKWSASIHSVFAGW